MPAEQRNAGVATRADLDGDRAARSAPARPSRRRERGSQSSETEPWSTTRLSHRPVMLQETPAAVMRCSWRRCSSSPVGAPHRNARLPMPH